ncbi:MAG: sugar ABC transporter permease [Devosia sp.]|jgi:ABC-type sugar transport system permease subunit|nr:sugar ABC transporter permease [Devosia sp.]
MQAIKAQARAEFISALAFLTPKVGLFCAFVVVPFLYTFYLMLFQGGLIGKFRFVGLGNFGALLDDGLLRSTVVNTLLFMAVNIPVTVGLSLGVGILLARQVKFRGVYRSLIYVPSLLSVSATGLVWKIMLDRDAGPLYGLFKHYLGLELSYLQSGTVALVTVALISAWASVGFYSLIFLAGLNGIPRELYEAGTVDGISPRGAFWHITLPLLKPVLQLVLILTSISAIQVFDIIFVLTQGGPGTSTYTVMWYIYKSVFGGGSVGYAATISVAVMVFSILLAGAIVLFTRSREAR